MLGRMNKFVLPEIQEILNIIPLQPKNASLVYLLANTMKKLQKIEYPTIDGNIVSLDKRQLLLKVIELDPRYVMAYVELTYSMTNNDLITMPDGEVLDKIGICKKLVEISPRNDAVYALLAKFMRSDTIDINGVNYTKQDLLAKSFELSSKKWQTYMELAASMRPKEKATLPSGEVLDKKEIIIRAMTMNPSSSAPYIALSHLLKLDEKIFALNRHWDRVDLLKKANELTPEEPSLYYHLSLYLRGYTSITLADGKTYDKTSLITKVLELDHTFGKAYYQLSNLMNRLRGYILPTTGEEMTYNKCLLYAIHYDSTYSSPYALLSFAIKGLDIKLINGQTMTSKQLALRALELDHFYILNYCYVAYQLEPNEKIDLPNGTTMDRNQIFDYALSVEPDNADMYFIFSKLLSKNEVVVLEKFGQCTKKSLLIEALKYRRFARFFFDLSSCLKPDETVEIEGMGLMDKKDLLLVSCSLKPHQKTYRKGLEKMLKPGEQIKLLNPKKIVYGALDE